MAKSGLIRSKILGSDRTDPTRLDLSEIPGGAEALERAVDFCYGVNFEITVCNVAALRCAAEYLEMTERVCDSNLTERTEQFIAKAALKTLSGAVTVLKSCEELGELAEEIGLVRRCVDAVSMKAYNEANFPTRSAVCGWLPELTSLSPSYLQKVLISMKSRGASPKTLSTVISTYAEKSLPDFLHPRSLSDLPLAIRTRQASHLNSIISLLKSTSASLPISFLCLLLRAAILLNSPSESKRDLEEQIASGLDQASVGDLLVVALDRSRERALDLDSVRRIVAGFVEEEGGGLYGGGAVCCSATVQRVAKTVDAFVGEIAADEELSVSKFAGVASALPKSARRVDDDLYRAVDIYLKTHPRPNEIEREKVCSVMDPLRLSYEARLHASQNKRLPLQVLLHVLCYDQLKLRSSDTREPTTTSLPPLSAAASARIRAGADASLMKENKELRSELTRMKLYLSDLEKNKKANKKPAFFASVSKTLGKLNPFKQGSKDTLNIDDELKVDVRMPRRRRVSIS